MATFRRGTAEKLSFIALEQLDLVLTLMAFSLGLCELNPIVKTALSAPLYLVIIKTVIPCFLAWLLPRKLLWPSIMAVALVVGWDIREMVIFFF